MTDPTPQTTPTRDEAVRPHEMAAHILRIAIEDRQATDTVEMNVGDLSVMLGLLLASAPASGGVNAMDKPCPFCGGTNTIQGGDDKVCGIFCKDCGAAGPNGYQSQLQWNDRASLSPAATPAQHPAVQRAIARGLVDNPPMIPTPVSGAEPVAWCESCGEAPIEVRLDVAGLCADCAQEQGK